MMCRLGLVALIVFNSIVSAYSQTALFSGRAVPPVSFSYNLVTNFGATCNGDAQTKTVSATITVGTKNLAVNTATFVAGDQTSPPKTIYVQGAGNTVDGSGWLTTTIAAFVDSTHVTLADNALTGLSASTSEIRWFTNDNVALKNFVTTAIGNNPVLNNLTLPGKCQIAPGAAPGASLGGFSFQGIKSLVVDGGSPNSSNGLYPYSPDNPFALGPGFGQYQDPNHSVRTADANVGDSCVTLLGQTLRTISNVTSSTPSPNVFTADLAGTTLTVTGTPTGTLAVGQFIDSKTTRFSAIITALGTGTGGAGTYIVNTSDTVASQSWESAVVTFQGAIAGYTLTVSSVVTGSGLIQVGQQIFGISGGGVNQFTRVQSQLTGTTGGVGTYRLSTPSTVSSAITMVAQGLVRLTVSSTLGMSDGQFTKVGGSIVDIGGLVFATLGIKRFKVIDSTHIDIVQSFWDARYGYVSGGTIGGDETSMFAVGGPALMGGWSNQSYWYDPYGFPSNFQYFDWLTVASVNSGTQQVCFTTPLTENYKSSWPNFNTGNLFEVDQGGPATLYVIQPNWDGTHVYQNMTIAPVWDSGATSAGRSVTYKNVNVLNNIMAGMLPSQNVDLIYDNVVDVGGHINLEIDKLIKNLVFKNGTSFWSIFQQSSATTNFITNGLTVSSLYGGGLHTDINNTTFVVGWSVPIAFYGNSLDAKCTNCTFNIPDNDSVNQGLVGFGGSTSVDNGSHSLWSMSGGVMTIPNGLNNGGAEMQTRAFYPGAPVFWNGSNLTNGKFKVLSITQDLDNVYVTTDQAGGFPPTVAYLSGCSDPPCLSIRAHPAPSLKITNPSGLSRTALSFATCMPGGGPMWSCQDITFTGGASGGTAAPPIVLFGKLVSINTTNITPYTNTGALSWDLSQFNNWRANKISDWTNVPNFATDTINTKLPSSGCASPPNSCTRTITPTSTSGAQTLDTLSAPGFDVWLGGEGASGPAYSGNTPSDTPQIRLQIQTDQSIPYLLRRDIDRSLPANDNRPMFVDKAA